MDFVLLFSATRFDFILNKIDNVGPPEVANQNTAILMLWQMTGRHVAGSVQDGQCADSQRLNTERNCSTGCGSRCCPFLSDL